MHNPYTLVSTNQERELRETVPIPKETRTPLRLAWSDKENELWLSFTEFGTHDRTDRAFSGKHGRL